MRRNNTSNQTSVLDNVFSGFPNLFGPPNTGASRNTNRNGCESRAPAPNSYSPHTPLTPLTQTNLSNQSQNHNPCFHRESTLGWLFGGLKSRDPAPNSYSPQTNIIYLSQKDITLNKLTSSCSVRFNV